MRISIATFNVENLIRAEKPIYDETAPHYTQDQYQQKTAWVRDQLLKMKADIVGFQEVFEEEALRDCLVGTEMAEWNLYVANPSGKRPVNALLSRFRIISTNVIERMPCEFTFFDDRTAEGPSGPTSSTIIPIEEFSRGVLLAELELRPGTNALIAVVHLKSKRPITRRAEKTDTMSYPELAKGTIRSLIRRGIEAVGVRHILSDCIVKREGVPIVVLGDLNDNDTAVTSQAILGDEPARKLPPEIKGERWKHVFQNCRDIQARKSIENFFYSYIHNGHYECLDNIFVSNHFAEQNAKRLGRVIDLRTFNDHVLDDKTSLDRKPVFVSDHGQIVANLELLEPARDDNEIH